MVELWKIIEANQFLTTVILSFLTVLGIAATAWFARRNNQNTVFFNLPTLTLKKNKSFSGQPGFRFIVDPEPGGRLKWLVSGVRLGGVCCRRYLAKTGEPTPKRASILIPFEPGPWQRRIRFDPPVAEDWVFLHSDAPDPVTIRFSVSVSGSPGFRKTRDVRYSRRV